MSGSHLYYIFDPQERARLAADKDEKEEFEVDLQDERFRQVFTGSLAAEIVVCSVLTHPHDYLVHPLSRYTFLYDLGSYATKLN